MSNLINILPTSSNILKIDTLVKLSNDALSVVVSNVVDSVSSLGKSLLDVTIWETVRELRWIF